MKRLLLLAIFICFAMQTAFCCSVVVLPGEVSRNFSIVLEHSAKPLQTQLSFSDIITGKLVRQVATDVYGRAAIQNLEPGTYRVTSPLSEDVIKVVPKGGSDVLHLSAPFDRPPVEVAAVTGTISDITGAVIPGAVVVLERLDTWHSPAAVGTADASGSISLKATDGAYLLRVASQGFQTAVIPLRITRTGWQGFALALYVGGCPGPSVPFTIKPRE